MVSTCAQKSRVKQSQIDIMMNSSPSSSSSIYSSEPNTTSCPSTKLTYRHAAAVCSLYLISTYKGTNVGKMNMYRASQMRCLTAINFFCSPEPSPLTSLLLKTIFPVRMLRNKTNLQYKIEQVHMDEYMCTKIKSQIDIMMNSSPSSSSSGWFVVCFRDFPIICLVGNRQLH